MKNYIVGLMIDAPQVSQLSLIEAVDVADARTKYVQEIDGNDQFHVEDYEYPDGQYQGWPIVILENDAHLLSTAPLMLSALEQALTSELMAAEDPNCIALSVDLFRSVIARARRDGS